MDGLEQTLGAILSDPDTMQKIQALAQSLGQPPVQTEKKPAPEPSRPGLDPALFQKLAGFAGQTGIDRDQQNLLAALSPYLSRDRIAKLENAMRAAKLARLASQFLESGGLKALTGR